MLQIVKWIVILLVTTISMLAQDTFTNKQGSQYLFKSIKNLDATPVENQSQTGTCWSFSSMSFIESEIIRLGGKPVDLSEMYVVRNAYVTKAENYLRMNGKANLDQGGEFHDLFDVIRNYGIVPESVYQGLNYGYETHNHDEMIAGLKGFIDGIKDKPQEGKLTPNWEKAATEIVDAYLGDLPDDLSKFTFTVDGASYTPFTYAQKLKLNPDDYVSLTSFTHHPYYKQFVFESPDNWSHQLIYNIPLDELIQTIVASVEKGYSVQWSSDISEAGFRFGLGVGIVPLKDSELRTSEEKQMIGLYVEDEKTITPEMRQIGFDNHTTTDDHAMHIVGLAKDQSGKRFFLVKNSHGTFNDHKGYIYVSEAFVRLKTLSIFLNKEAVPVAISAKLK